MVSITSFRALRMRTPAAVVVSASGHQALKRPGTCAIIVQHLTGVNIVECDTYEGTRTALGCEAIEAEFVDDGAISQYTLDLIAAKISTDVGVGGTIGHISALATLDGRHMMVYYNKL